MYKAGTIALRDTQFQLDRGALEVKEVGSARTYRVYGEERRRDVTLTTPTGSHDFPNL